MTAFAPKISAIIELKILFNSACFLKATAFLMADMLKSS